MSDGLAASQSVGRVRERFRTQMTERREREALAAKEAKQRAEPKILEIMESLPRRQAERLARAAEAARRVAEELQARKREKQDRHEKRQAEQIANKRARKAAARKPARRKKTTRHNRRSGLPTTPRPTPFLDQMAMRSGHASYRAYLQSDCWASTKRNFKSRWPMARCLGCDQPRYQLHHITYARFGRESMGDMVPLCQACHSKIHDTHRKRRIPLIDYVRALTAMLGPLTNSVERRIAEYNRHVDVA